jgi:hypothetical protein
LPTGVIAALAIAAPVAQASAATPVAVPLPAGLPAFIAPLLASAGPSRPVAKGPTVIGSVFNGATTVVVSTSPAAGSVHGSH